MIFKISAVIIISPVFIGPGVLIFLLGASLGQIYMKAQLSVKREGANAKAPVLGQWVKCTSSFWLTTCSPFRPACLASVPQSQDWVCVLCRCFILTIHDFVYSLYTCLWRWTNFQDWNTATNRQIYQSRTSFLWLEPLGYYPNWRVRLIICSQSCRLSSVFPKQYRFHHWIFSEHGG